MSHDVRNGSCLAGRELLISQRQKFEDFAYPYVTARTDHFFKRILQFHFELISLRRTAMGKYLLGWVLGVPAVVLVVIYLIAN